MYSMEIFSVDSGGKNQAYKDDLFIQVSLCISEHPSPHYQNFFKAGHRWLKSSECSLPMHMGMHMGRLAVLG